MSIFKLKFINNLIILFSKVLLKKISKKLLKKILIITIILFLLTTSKFLFLFLKISIKKISILIKFFFFLNDDKTKNFDIFKKFINKIFDFVFENVFYNNKIYVNVIIFFY